MATACHEGRPTGDRRNKGTAHRRTGTPQAREQGTQAAGIDTGTGLQAGRQGRKAPHKPHRDGKKGKTPHPPPAEEADMPLTPLKIRAIFFDKPFSMQLNLAKSGNWSRKSRGG
jgi:hypothetical protein